MVLSRHWQPRSVSPDGSAYSPQKAGPSTAESWQVPSKDPSAANAAVTDFGESGSINSKSSVWPESVSRSVTRARTMKIACRFKGPKLSGSWNGSAGYTSTAGGVGLRFANPVIWMPGAATANRCSSWAAIAAVKSSSAISCDPEARSERVQAEVVAMPRVPRRDQRHHVGAGLLGTERPLVGRPQLDGPVEVHVGQQRVLSRGRRRRRVVDGVVAEVPVDLPCGDVQISLHRDRFGGGRRGFLQHPLQLRQRRVGVRAPR